MEMILQIAHQYRAKSYNITDNIVMQVEMVSKCGAHY